MTSTMTPGPHLRKSWIAVGAALPLAEASRQIGESISLPRCAGTAEIILPKTLAKNTRG